MSSEAPKKRVPVACLVRKLTVLQGQVTCHFFAYFQAMKILRGFYRSCSHHQRSDMETFFSDLKDLSDLRSAGSSPEKKNMEDLSAQILNVFDTNVFSEKGFWDLVKLCWSTMHETGTFGDLGINHDRSLDCKIVFLKFCYQELIFSELQMYGHPDPDDSFQILEESGHKLLKFLEVGFPLDFRLSVVPKIGPRKNIEGNSGAYSSSCRESSQRFTITSVNLRAQVLDSKLEFVSSYMSWLICTCAAPQLSSLADTFLEQCSLFEPLCETLVFSFMEIMGVSKEHLLKTDHQSYKGVSQALKDVLKIFQEPCFETYSPFQRWKTLKKMLKNIPNQILRFSS